LGAFFSEKYRPNDMGAIFQKNRPIFTLISSTFRLLFVLKFLNLNQMFLWAKVLNYQGSILGAIWTNFGRFFHQTSGHTGSKGFVADWKAQL
jgi:hypothetical protein